MKKCLSNPKIGRKGETQEGKIEDKQKITKTDQKLQETQMVETHQ